MRKPVRGGIIAFIGYMLSPLSWWNDLIVNIPIAYGFAVLVSLISCQLFTPAMIAGYWLTNVAGLIMMHRGISDITRREIQGQSRVSSSDYPGFPLRDTGQRRDLLVNLAIGTGYTLLIVVLALTGILKPPAMLKRECPTSPLHFAREEIDMKVRPGYVEIGGNYHFTNAFSKPTSARIFYPFPLDSIHGYPDSIVLLTRGDTMPHRVPGDSGVYFMMSFVPRQEDSFYAWYRQPLRGNAARYIVTTTRAWGRAIDMARFRISVPASLQDVKLSYRPDRIERTDSIVVYHFARRGFYPDKDVVVTWR